MVALTNNNLTRLIKDDKGDVIVEATILFPIIIMIFAAFVMLATYMPVRGNVQRAAQYAASIISVQESDTWIKFDKDQLKQQWLEKSELPNVYAQALGAIFETSHERSEKQGVAETIVKAILDNGIVSNNGEITDIDCEVKNYVIYKEIVVTVEYEVQMPLKLSFIGFDNKYTVSESATAIVTDGDGFVRNIDMLTDFVNYLNKKYNLKLDKLSECLGKVFEFMGI